jgi:hypothetical protein
VAVRRGTADFGIPGLTIAAWTDAGFAVVTSEAGGREVAGVDWGGGEAATFGATGAGGVGLAGASAGAAGRGKAGSEVAASGAAGLGVAGSGTGGLMGVVGADLVAPGPNALRSVVPRVAAAGPEPAGCETVFGCGPAGAVGGVAVAVLSTGKVALILLDEASTAVVGLSGAFLVAESPVACGAGLRRGRRGRSAAGGGLPSWGGFAILGFTPLFSHINEILDRAAILPSA